MKRVSACTLDCGDCCSLVVEDKEGKISVSGNPEHPFTEGVCCSKGAVLYKRLMRQDRILYPMLKKDGQFERISWDEALDLCASKLDALQQTPESALHVRGFGYRGVLANASFNFFDTFGASGTYGALCDDAGCTASAMDFGDLNHNALEDLLNADCCVNWGKDISRSSLHLSMILRQARKQGTRILTISPGGDGNAPFTDDFIRIRPGTDRFLAAALCKALFEDHDKAPLERSFNHEDFRKLVCSKTYDDLLAACNVTAEDFEKLLGYYTGPKPTASVIGWGVQRHAFGGQSVRFINAVAFLSGNVGKSGGGAYFNIPSSRNFEKWNHLVETDRPKRDRRKLNLPRLGRELPEAAPEIKFMWCDGTNWVNQGPDAQAAASAMENIPFSVTVDAFWNDTTLRSTLVLPCALPLEHEEILGSCMHDWVNWSGKVFDPRGEARPDFYIMNDLGQRLTTPIRFPSAETCFNHALSFVGLTIDEMREQAFVKADRPDIAFEDLKFGHDDGLYRFPETLDQPEEQNPEYPDTLLTLVDKRYMHSQIPEEEQADMLQAVVSSEHPVWKQLPEDKKARLVSEYGSLEVTLEEDSSLHPQTVIVRRGGWMKNNRSANAIIGPHTTDISDSAAYYKQRVRIDPA